MAVKPNVEWNKMESGWYQKTIKISGQVPQYTYHFQMKSSKPCKVIEVNSKFAKQYAAYCLIEIDLRDTLQFINELSIFLKDEEQRKNIYLKKALVRAIVITYGKCFASTKNRKVQLNASNISSENKAVHYELINMRNEYVAHAGNSQHEDSQYCLVLSPLKYLKKKQALGILKSVESHQTIITPSFVDDRCIKLIKELDSFVKNRMTKLEKKLALIPGSDYSSLYTLVGKKTRISLDEKASDAIFENNPLKIYVKKRYRKF